MCSQKGVLKEKRKSRRKKQKEKHMEVAMVCSIALGLLDTLVTLFLPSVADFVTKQMLCILYLVPCQHSLQ